jgi:hypothetical protein
MLLMLAMAACGHGPELPGSDQSAANWRLVNPRPFDVSINDIWGDPRGRMIAVGDDGAVMVKEGPVWRPAPRPTDTDIISVHGCDWEHIWAVCGEGLLFFDGRRWTLARPGWTGTSDMVWCRAPDDVMFVNGEDASQHFDGQSWRTQVIPVGRSDGARRRLVGWWRGYTVVGRHGLAATWADGRWGPAESVGGDVDLTDVVVNTGTEELTGHTLHALGPAHTGHGSYESFDRIGTRAWTFGGTFNLGGELLDIAASRARSGYFLVSRTTGRDSVRVVHSWHDFGWGDEFVLPGLDSAVLHVADNRFDRSDDLDYLDLAGAGGTFCAGDHESGFTDCVGGFPFRPQAFQVWSNGDFTAIDPGVGLLHGRSGSLSQQTGDIPGGLKDVWGPDPQTIYVVGDFGKVLLLAPETAPIAMPLPTPAVLTVVWGTAADDVWAAGKNVFVHYDGTSWQLLPALDGVTPIHLGGYERGKVFLQGTDRIWQWDGTAWSDHLLYSTGWIADMGVAPGDSSLYVLSREYFPPAVLKRYQAGAWTDLGPVSDAGPSLVALGGGRVLVGADPGFRLWDNGEWRTIPDSGHDGPPSKRPLLRGTGASGIYRISTAGSIHFFDLEGTGLWQ